MNKETSFTIKGDGTLRPTVGEGERALAELVDKRKSIWEREGSVSADRRICKENADTILDTPILREAVMKKPYLLIECCFSIVNKEKRDAPFFFNRVQSDFIRQLEIHGTESLLPSEGVEGTVSALAEYDYNDNKIKLKILVNGVQTSSADITDAVGAYVSRTFFGGA